MVSNSDMPNFPCHGDYYTHRQETRLATIESLFKPTAEFP